MNRQQRRANKVPQQLSEKQFIERVAKQKVEEVIEDKVKKAQQETADMISKMFCYSIAMALATKYAWDTKDIYSLLEDEMTPIVDKILKGDITDSTMHKWCEQNGLNYSRLFQVGNA